MSGEKVRVAVVGAAGAFGMKHLDGLANIADAEVTVVSGTKPEPTQAVAEKYGVGMEAELGQIMGVEDDMVVDEADSILTDPEDARRFCDALDLSAFACAVGTAHGFYHGDPVVDFDRALAWTAAPDQLSPAYDSGDHLHPDDAGYRAMADAVDIADLG